MDVAALVRAAAALEAVLSARAQSNDDARLLMGALAPLLSAAQEGRITSALRWQDVPGSYFFEERGLRELQDLSLAFSRFRIEVTGGETPFLKELREKYPDPK